MVSPIDYYAKVKVSNNPSLPLGQRIQSTLDDVVLRLPNEEQFRMRGMINFFTRQQAIEYWTQIGPTMGMKADFMPHNRDGNCTYSIAKNVEDSIFVITIIVDNLESRSDNYIKGLIAHELSEMSCSWRSMQNEKDVLEKLKPKARQVRINQITKQNAVVGTKDHQEHENNVDNEARRLGFSKEIDALNS